MFGEERVEFHILGLCCRVGVDGRDWVDSGDGVWITMPGECNFNADFPLCWTGEAACWAHDRGWAHADEVGRCGERSDGVKNWMGAWLAACVRVSFIGTPCFLASKKALSLSSMQVLVTLVDTRKGASFQTIPPVLRREDAFMRLRLRNELDIIICSRSLSKFEKEIRVMSKSAVLIKCAHVHERETVRG